MKEDKLFELLFKMYRGEIDRADIDLVACRYCTHKVDGECPRISDEEECHQSDEEAIRLYIKYKFGEEQLSSDAQMNPQILEDFWNDK